MPPPPVTVHDTPLGDAAGSGGSSGSGADVLASALHRSDGAGVVSALTRDLTRSLGLDVDAVLAQARPTGEAGEVVQVPITATETGVRRLVLVGLGGQSPVDLRRAGAALARSVTGAKRLATDTALGLRADGARAHLEGLLLAAYAISRDHRDHRDHPDSRGDRAPVAMVDVHLPGAASAETRAALERGGTTARAVHLARDLANTPPQQKDPAWLAEQARELGHRHGLTVTVRDEQQLATEGFGGIVAVGSGSSRPPRLIELRYLPEGAARSGPHVVLVGKGITFDSGGLSLKPRDAMVGMKTDMAAGGAVLAVMSALRDAGVRARVTALVAAAENLPGASALRPGDVVRQYGGRTVEVFNTDAEGRLVLADALAYADARLDPDVLVDLATLTGAASLGLGRRHGALYSADEDLVTQLRAAADSSGDLLWRMPLVEDYRDALDSEVADLSNISRDPHILGGSVTAALFLREFVGRRRWAHLDIAGPARADKDEHEVTRGGTGYGARLLLRWLEELR